MSWQLKPKPDLQALRDHIKLHDLDEADFPILATQPSLFHDLLWIWDGFHALSASRQRGFSSLQPLAMAEIVSYAGFRGFRGEERLEFLHLIQFMDQLFMTEMDARQPKK